MRLFKIAANQTEWYREVCFCQKNVYKYAKNGFVTGLKRQFLEWTHTDTPIQKAHADSLLGHGRTHHYGIP